MRWWMMPKHPNRFTTQQEEDDANFKALLRALAEESPKDAPLRVRERLQSMIQQDRSPVLVSRRRPLFIAAAASALLVAAAAILAIAALSNRRVEKPELAPVLATSARSTEAPRGTQIPNPPVASQPPAAKAKRHHRRLPAKNQQPVFVALPFSDPTLANGTNVTVRMTFSDAELLALGVAPGVSEQKRFYVADVILGDDGLPRAIRVLPNLSGMRGGS
jgi:hypothetical protein